MAILQKKIDFKEKCYKSPKKDIHIDKRANLSRSYNNKQICTKQQTPKIYKVNTDRFEGRNDNFTIIVGDLNTHF